MWKTVVVTSLEERYDWCISTVLAFLEPRGKGGNVCTTGSIDQWNHNLVSWAKGFLFFFQSNSSMDREIHVMNDLVNLGHASWSDSVRNAHGAWIINWERNPYILSENMTDKPSTWLWRKFSLKKFTTSILKEFLLYKFITKILKEIFV